MVNPIVEKRSVVSVRDFLLAGFLIFIPFSQALTINISFPLKVSELFLVALVIYEIVTGSILKWKLNTGIFYSIVAFISLILISLVVNIFYKYPYELALNLTRLSPALDSILKFFYILIAFAALFVTRNAFKIDERIIKYFFWGCILSCLYAWYLFFSGILRLPIVYLPGMDTDSQVYDVGFGDIIRSGTFKEGNYMGFYLVVSGILANYYKKNKLSLFFFATIITTFSTTAILCSIVFFVICLYHKYKRYKLKFFGSIFIISAFLAVLIQLSPGFRTLLFNKIFGSEDTVENTNDVFSKADRLNTAYVALQIAADNPILGVGPANFGLHYSHYNLIEDFELDAKRIPNNIYVEILSECGSLALIAFLTFLFLVYKYGSQKSYLLGAGLIASFIYFFAFPTFTMLFIWVFLGIVLV